MTSEQISLQHLRLEASSNCQLKCPSCPTAAGEIQRSIGGGFLKFDDFKALVDDNPSLTHIELSNWGEIFLNPQIVPLIDYAYQRGIALTATNGANLNTVKEEALEALAKYHFHHITCSIDGASQETYSVYRKGGNFEQVIETIQKINAYKQTYQTDLPRLTWQFIVFGHNQHEIQKAREMAHSLGMDFFAKLSWDQEFSPVQDQNAVQQAIGGNLAKQDDYWQKVICSQLWNIPQVNWDGRVLGCCVNTWGDFGNAFESGLEAVVKGETMSHARQMLLGEREEKAGIPCTTCWYYAAMKKTQTWMTNEDIQTFSNPLITSVEDMNLP